MFSKVSKTVASPQSAERCSFCNRSVDEVQKLIAGPSVFICDGCVDSCVDILANDSVAEAAEAAREAFSASTSRHESDVRCTLCAMVVEIKNALYFENRAVLCPACVSSIALAAKPANPVDEN